MQDLDTNYETAMLHGHHLVGAPLVIAEWNFNNIFEPTVSNTPDDQNWEYGKKYFPVKSVTHSIRPKASGIFAAFTRDAYTSSPATVSANRYYTVGADPETVFNYWICPTVSDLTKYGAPPTGEDEGLPEAYGVSRGTVLVEYPEYCNMNKVRVLFNLGPIPVEWSIFVHTEGAPGDGYIEIANPTVDPLTGKAEIWFDGDDWVETQQLSESDYSPVDKIKVEVRAVDRPGKYLQIVEIAGGREINLSQRVQQYEVNYQMDDVDFIAPVGRMVSADGSIIFNNTDLKINELDPASDFYGLLKGRCEYRTYVKYDMTDYGGGDLNVRTGTLFANDWQQQNEYEYSVELWDVFKLLQTKKIPARLFENMPIAKVLSQILDSVGIDSYNLDFADYDSTSIVKYFWADGDEFVFDMLDRLCKSYQAALYVDEFGVIQLLTRGQIANETDTPVWTFKGEQVGADLADIATLNKKYSLQANDVTIKYKQMEAPVDVIDVTQQPLTSKVWESQDTVVLRAAPVLRDISDDGLDHPNVSHKDLYINPTFVANWPYKGKVNIDGELIEYDGKGYFYWDYSTDPPTKLGAVVKSDEEKRKLDKQTYASFPSSSLSTPGGISSDPTKQNAFSGRLVTTKRDADAMGRQSAHSIHWNYGWMGLKAWCVAPGNAAYPGKYVEPGSNKPYSMANLQNYKTRTNWNSTQTRWSVANSVLKCDSTTGGDNNLNALIRDVGNTECREFGTRMRLTGTSGMGGIVFYLTDKDGYDTTNPTLTDPHQADRWYQLTITTTDVAQANKRNEIALEVKNGNTLTKLTTMRAINNKLIGSDGKWTINKNTWYDIDIVVKDGKDTNTAGTFSGTTIEVYIDGQWIDTWKTTDRIKSTGLMGVFTRQTSIAEFEYFYATSATTNGNPGFTTEENFEMQMFNLASGTNKKATLNLAGATTNTPGFQSVLSLSAVGSQATISSLKVKGVSNGVAKGSKQLGPLTIKPDTKVTIDIDGAIPYASLVDLTYTSTNELSVCWEYTTQRNMPYDIETYVTPPNHFWYDLAKGGYLSTKHDYFAMERPLYPVYTEGSILLDDRTLFSDDFGAIAHEVRDFDVEYDVKPAKGTRIFISNNKIRLVDHKYNPGQGLFTLANASNKDEIVNGQEEINDSDTIDHVLMIYGYILEDKGDKTKIVKQEGSIRRYGSVAIDLNAEWIFNETEAEALGAWITEHWADPMDTVTLEVFSNTFTQIGDKVNIIFDNANIDPTWLYIVTEKSVDFGSDGLTTSVTLRRVR